MIRALAALAARWQPPRRPGPDKICFAGHHWPLMADFRLSACGRAGGDSRRSSIRGRDTMVSRDSGLWPSSMTSQTSVRPEQEPGEVEVPHRRMVGIATLY